MKNTVLVKVSTIFKPLLGDNRYVSGIGRSTYHLLEALGKIENLPFNLRLYGAGLSSLYLNARGLPFRYRSFPLPMSLGTQKTKLESCYLEHFYKHDLLHIPHNYDYVLNNNLRFVVTIHDTCEYDSALKNNIKNRVDVWKYAAMRSIKIVTCSNCSKNDIIDRFEVPEDKIVVIPWGISTDLFHLLSKDEVDSVLLKYEIAQPYLLAVSCSNERKNINNLLKAFRNFTNTNNQVILILLWSNPPMQLLSEYSKEIEKGKIKFLSYVTDNDLVGLYNGAIATMYPSRYEGFGFPVLESFACGAPVMTCNNSSLSEVGSDLAVYVGEDNVDEMTQVMEMFCNAKYDFDLFRINAEKYVSKFSWSRTAEKYVDFYMGCMNK